MRLKQITRFQLGGYCGIGGHYSHFWQHETNEIGLVGGGGVVLISQERELSTLLPTINRAQSNRLHLTQYFVTR